MLLPASAEFSLPKYPPVPHTGPYTSSGPAPPASPRPVEILSDLADALSQGGRTAARDWARPLIAERASRRAVEHDRPLTDLELETLVRDLSRTEMPYTSPRGKPTVILTTLRELHRKFGRE